MKESTELIGRPGPPAGGEAHALHYRGIVSIILLALAWAALDDITTDNASSFGFEYSCLAVVFLWFFSLFISYLRRGPKLPGILMMALLIAAGWAVVTLPPRGHPAGSWRAVVVLAAFACFLCLAASIAWRDMRTLLKRSRAA